MRMLIGKTVILLCMLVFPLLLVGFIGRVKSVWAGRQGPSILQPVYDVVRLLRKGEVVSTRSSFVLAVAPSLSLAAVVSASLVVPAGPFGTLLSFRGDFLFFAGMFALSKLMIVANAMDTGSSFEGMGASREVSFTALIEPSFYLLIASVAYLSGYTSLSGVFTLFHAHGGWSFILVTLAATALFIMLLVEGARVPVDDPATHLELTMIHEVMVLDNSGPDLAFIVYSAALKIYLVAAMIVSLIILPGLPFYLSAGLFAGILFAVALLVGLIESLRPRLRMIHVPEFTLLMLSISLLICAGVIIYRNGGAQ